MWSIFVPYNPQKIVCTFLLPLPFLLKFYSMYVISDFFCSFYVFFLWVRGLSISVFLFCYITVTVCFFIFLLQFWIFIKKYWLFFWLKFFCEVDLFFVPEHLFCEDFLIEIVFFYCYFFIPYFLSDFLFEKVVFWRSPFLQKRRTFLKTPVVK